MANANNKKRFVPLGKRNNLDDKIAQAKTAKDIVDDIRANSPRNLPNFVLNTPTGNITSTIISTKPKPPNQTTQQKRADLVSKDPINAVCPELDKYNHMVDNIGTSNSTDSPIFEKRRTELQAACNKRANSPKNPTRTKIVSPNGSSDGGSHLVDNVLNDYINVQYHVTLSMLTESAAADVQARIPVNTYNSEVQENLRQELKRQGAIVLASTGDNQRQTIDDLDVSAIARKRVATTSNDLSKAAFDEAVLDPDRFSIASDPFAIESNIDPNNTIGAAVLKGRDYYNIKSMTLENLLAPSVNDPYVSNMVAIGMTLVEPNGFRFIDDLRLLRCALGWEQVNASKVVYRIDVKWSGYDPSSGNWVSSIPLNARKKNRKTSLTYYVTITEMEGNVTTTGTEYKISLAPVGVNMFSGTGISIDASSVFTGTQNTFGGFADNLASFLNNKTKQNTISGITGAVGLEREFEFIMPNQLRESTFYMDDFSNNQNYLNENKDKGTGVQLGRNADLITILRVALSDVPHVQESFINNTGDGTNDDFVSPRVHYTFRFNTIYGSEKVANVHDYKHVKVQVIIEPFVTFRKGSVTPESLAEYVKPESQVRRIESMQAQGLIIRKYDYLNTSENTEVIDFGLNFSSFYYQSLSRNQDWPGVKGIGAGNTSSDIGTRNNVISNRANLPSQINATPNKRQAGALLKPIEEQTAVERLFGGRSGTTSPERLNSVCNPNQVFGGGFGVTRDQDAVGSNTSDGDKNSRKDQYYREFLDYTENDFMNIDSLKVRGDPVWMFTPYSNEIIDLVTLLTPEQGNIITPTGDKIIFLNIRRANQNDAMDPNRKTATTSDPSYIGGFYDVRKVISTFEGGLFTQVITASKMNHLNFAESQIGLEDFNNQDTSNVVSKNQDIMEPHPIVPPVPVELAPFGSVTQFESVFNQGASRSDQVLRAFDSTQTITNVLDRPNKR